MKDLKVYDSYEEMVRARKKEEEDRIIELENIIKNVDNKKLPESEYKEIVKELGNIQFNKELSIPSTFSDRINQQRYGMYAIVTRDWVRELVEWLDGRKVLEVMSGRGWIAKTIREEGGDIIATDNMSSYQNWRDKGLSELCDIENLSAVDAIKKYGKDVDFVLMAWPPYNKPQATDVAKEIQKVNPDIKIIYIGESQGGCTADEEFFDLVTEIEDDTFEVVGEFYNTHDWVLRALNDFMYLYKVGGNK